MAGVDIFISYKREERDKAKALAEAFTLLGYNVWWDIELLPGDQFAREIEAFIDQAKMAVVLWSRLSISSAWVFSEALMANDRGIYVGARLDDCEPPHPFKGNHYADLTVWQGDPRDAALDSLKKAALKLVGRRTEVAAADATIEKKKPHRAGRRGGSLENHHHLAATFRRGISALP